MTQNTAELPKLYPPIPEEKIPYSPDGVEWFTNKGRKRYTYDPTNSAQIHIQRRGETFTRSATLGELQKLISMMGLKIRIGEVQGGMAEREAAYIREYLLRAEADREDLK